MLGVDQRPRCLAWVGWCVCCLMAAGVPADGMMDDHNPCPSPFAGLG